MNEEDERAVLRVIDDLIVVLDKHKMPYGVEAMCELICLASLRSGVTSQTVIAHITECLKKYEENKDD